MKNYTNKFALVIFAAAIVFCANNSVFSQKLVDTFEYANAEESMMRIDNFMFEMQNDPKATAYFIIYGGKVNKKGEVDAHINQLPDYLKLRGYDKDRIVLINGGFREKLSWEFWIVPFGEYIPEPSPTLDKKDVKIKGKFKKKKNSSLYNCC